MRNSLYWSGSPKPLMAGERAAVDGNNRLNRALNMIAGWLDANRPPRITPSEGEQILSEMFWQLLHFSPFVWAWNHIGHPDLCVWTGHDHVVVLTAKDRRV